MSRWIRTLVVLAVCAVPVRANLIVSFFGTSPSSTAIYDNQGHLLSPSGSGGEGAACVAGTPQALFVADNSSIITVLDPGSLTTLGSLTLMRTSSTPASKIAALALSPDGNTLYAADYFSGYLIAVSTSAILNAVMNHFTSVVAFASVQTAASHDVAVDANGVVYSSHFSLVNEGVKKFSSTLVPLGQFLTQSQLNGAGITNPAGILATPGGIFISNFTTVTCPNPNCSSVVEFDMNGTVLHASLAPAGSLEPLGLALGPGDGNVYVALFGSNQIGKIDVAGGTYQMSVFFSTSPRSKPKYLQFTDNCITPTDAFIEICKKSSLTDPVTGNFTFVATNGTFTSAPITIPPGACSGPIGVMSGTVQVNELPQPGTGVSSITAYGYNPNTGILENRLLSSDLANFLATVSVPAGSSAAETIVEFTNYSVPTGVIEVCKDASPGVSGNFSFNVAGAANNPYTVPVGACSGPILVQAGAVTITEVPRAGYSLSGVTTDPPDRLVSLNFATQSAVVTAPAGNVTGETVVHFTNAPGTSTGQLKLCKVAGPGVVLGQMFTITVNGTTNYAVPAGPASTGGNCVVDGTFPIGTTVTVAETPQSPLQVLDISVNPPDRANGRPVVTGQTWQQSVTVGSGFTEVTVTNVGATSMGQLKICKIAGSKSIAGLYSFSVANGTTTQIVRVPAGPPSGGYCMTDGTFPIRTKLTISENLPGRGVAVSGVSVNGVPEPAGSTSATVTLSSGITEVAFTNESGNDATPSSPPFLSVVNYQVVSRTDDSVTYRADLLNAGPALASVRATVASADSSLRVTGGSNVLDFAPVPANSEVTSVGTFTVATSGAIDFSKLKWTLEAKALPHRRAAGK